MGSLNHLWSASPQTLAWALQELQLVQDPLSEADILQMQSLFLQNGLHSLKVRSVYASRSLFYKMLDSLNVYHNQACLSLDINPLRMETRDVLQDLLVGGYLDPLQDTYLDDFFIDHFYYDFLWIELSQNMLLAPWFYTFRAKIFALNLERSLPIFMVAFSSPQV